MPPPPPDVDGNGAPPPPTRREEDSRRKAHIAADGRAEAHLLNGLLENPDAYYLMNGKLREVAAGDEKMLRGPLAPFSGQDFSRTGLRALMELFLEALEQDDYDVPEYIALYVDESLKEEMALVAENRLLAKLQDPVAVAQGDLERVIQKIQRAGLIIDERNDLISQAIRVRCRRLNREREELRLAQMNAYANGDNDYADICATQIDLLARAVYLLELEEKQVSRLY